jgi:hypothetical protein
VSLWQDANADFIKHKTKFEEELALKEAESIRRLKEEEDTIRNDYRKVLITFAEAICGMAETVICESHGRVKSAMYSLHNFIHPDKLIGMTLPPIGSHNVSSKMSIRTEITDSTHHNTALIDPTPRHAPEDDEITAVSALSYETGALVSENKSSKSKSKVTSDKNTVAVSHMSAVSSNTETFTSIPEMLQAQADDDISVLSEDGTYNSGFILPKAASKQKNFGKIAV